MSFLQRVELTGSPDRTRYPFTVPSIGGLDTLALSTPVTFFVGENGSGKSTLLEAIAPIGGRPYSPRPPVQSVPGSIAHARSFWGDLFGGTRHVELMALLNFRLREF